MRKEGERERDTNIGLWEAPLSAILNASIAFDVEEDVYSSIYLFD